MPKLTPDIDLVLDLINGEAWEQIVSELASWHPADIADIIELGAPYQGEWYVIGIPEAGRVVEGYVSSFWNVNIRRRQGSSSGK